jgi:phenylacetate-coenzyme A ligase PaaK-like adenylate-forming protein
MPPCILDAWLAGTCGAGAANLVEAIEAEQRARLQAQADYARARSRFYREHLPGISGNHVSRALSGLPFTTAQDILDWQSFLCVSQDRVERMVTLQSSGTSGPPKRLAFSLADLALTKDFFQAGMAQLVRAGDRALALWPGAARPCGVSALLREALGEKGITVFAGDPAATADSLRREIAEYDPRAIIAAPRQLAPLAALLSGGAFAGRRIALRGILSSAESLPPDLLHKLQDYHGLLVLEHYGLAESGYGCGVECPAHDGYHLRELDLLVEIVDIESGRSLPDGETGEIVITTLTREAMPLIRYRTGDAAAMLPGPCRCGSPLRRLSSVKGRIVRTGAGYSMATIAKGSFYERTAHASL